jgi:hypothetical protein
MSENELDDECMDDVLEKYQSLKKEGIKCDRVNRNALRFYEKIYDSATNNLCDELYFTQQGLSGDNSNIDNLREKVYGIVSLLCPGQEEKVNNLSDEDIENSILTGDEGINAMFEAFDGLIALLEDYKEKTIFMNDLRNNPEKFYCWRGRINKELIYYVEYKTVEDIEKDNGGMFL